LANLARLRWLGAAFCALAIVCTTANANAIAPGTENEQAKTRVGGFEQNSPLNVCANALASAETHRGISTAQCESASAFSHAAEGEAGLQTVTNSVPTTLARVIPGEGPFPTLGPASSPDVFVTAADGIAGMTPAQISNYLTIPYSPTYSVYEFATPAEGLASPVFRANPGFVGGGLTSGGAPEFVLPNGPIPADALHYMVGQ
jgi:hypothetical protein